MSTSARPMPRPSKFVLKLKTKSGPVVVNGLSPKNYISDLKDILEKLTGIQGQRINALKGFPPKPLNLQCDESTLEDIGIFSGDTLIIQEKEASVQDHSGSSANTKPTVYKPMPTTHSNSSGNDKRKNYSSELSSKPRPRPSMPSPRPRPITTTNDQMVGSHGVLLKQIIPGDNSCLFTSVGFTLSGLLDMTSGKTMRAIIAQRVSENPQLYSEAMLGKPNAEYCAWILKPESWGGGIELAVLSDFFGFEIAVINIVSASISTFGEDKEFTKRCYLVFDGVHYDALYLEPFEAGVPIQTMFDTTDQAVLQEVNLYAQEAHSRHEFTDLKGFKLECKVCHMGLSGQIQAAAHAKRTGHQNFGEVGQM